MSANGPNQQPTTEAHAVRAIARVSHNIADEADPCRALWTLVAAIRQHLPLDRVGIFSYDAASRLISRVVGVAGSGDAEYEGEAFPADGANSPLLRVVRRETPYYLSEDAAAEFPEHRFHPGVRALAVLPILAGGELLGALAVDNCISGRPIPAAVLEPLFLCARLAALPLFALHQQRERERTDAGHWHTLRSVFCAVTHGKVRLCDADEIGAEWPAAADLMLVRRVDDIPPMRAAVRQAGESAGMDRDRARDLELCVSEAATNALLHGNGGAVCVGRNGDVVRARVLDSGTGISLDDLPGATLQPGWSTRSSMGLGFTVITQTADRMLLHTGPGGTTVIIEMAAQPELNLPDEGNPMLWGETLTL